MPVAIILLLFGLAVAVYLDITVPRWIPNLLTIPMALAGLLSAFLTRGLDGLGDHMVGMAALLLLFLFLWSLRIVGGGDAKLCAAVGAFLGGDHIGAFLVAWGIFNLVCGLWATFRGSGYSLRRWVAEQRVSLQALSVGVLSKHGAHGYRGAVSISLATVAALAVPYFR